MLVTCEALGLDGGRGTAGVSQWSGQKWYLCSTLSHLAISSWHVWGHFVGAGDQKREGRMFYCLSSLPFRGFWQKGLVFMLLVSPAEGTCGRSVWSEAVCSYCDVTLECKCITFAAGVSNILVVYSHCFDQITEKIWVNLHLYTIFFNRRFLPCLVLSTLTAGCWS